MEVRTIEDKQTWEDFVRPFPLNSMLQSWNWGEFAKKQGRTIWRLGLYDGDTLVGVNQLVKITAKRANYIESHGGPMVVDNNIELFKPFHEHITQLARDEKVHFFRIRPPLFNSDKAIAPYLSLGYRKAPMYFQAEHTMHLDITPPEEDLLKGMRKNTRYYVKKAEKNGVNIRFSQDVAEIDLFFDLYSKTVERQQFVPYNKKYFLDEFESFLEDDLIELVFAEFQGKTVAGAMIVRYGSMGYYHHSGSIRTNPESYANYKLQWEVIRRLKSQGMKTYDFFGVAPNDDPNQSRAGLTKFKRGFGGERVRLLHTLDYPINNLWYWPMYLFVRIERWKRGL